MQQVIGSELESLYREHRPRLWRALLLYAGDPEVASDAVAEAFAQALQRGDALRTPMAWIWRAAFRIAAGELKRRGRVAMAVDVPYEMPEPVIELTRALASLSPKQRAAVVLHYYGGYTLAEIAEIIGSSRAAVGVHLHRARARLRPLLEDRDG